MAKKAAKGRKKADGGSISWEFKLYVVGNHVKSKIAIDQIRKICIGYLSSNCHIEVIDLNKKPEVAMKERIVATPMLVKMSPGPRKVLIGDLTNEYKVLNSLEIRHLIDK